MGAVPQSLPVVYAVVWGLSLERTSRTMSDERLVLQEMENIRFGVLHDSGKRAVWSRIKENINKSFLGKIAD